MIEVKQNTQVRVAVRLLTSTGTPVIGKVIGDITVSVGKSNGVSANVSGLISADWAELGSGDATSALNNTGSYMLRLPTSVTDQVGALVYAVKCTGADTYIGSIKVVANEEADTFQVVSGRMEIHTTGPFANYMTVYAADGITAKYRYALYNKNGEPSTLDIYKRVPVPL